jgi:cytochrome o ubiquinol oxidase subunit 2
MASGLGRAVAVRRLGRWAILAAAALALCGCYPAVLDPQGPVGAGEKLILLDSLAIMLAIVLPVIIATLGFAWWFRASNSKARRLPDWAFSGRVELVVWSIPVLVIMFLGGLAWIASHDLDPAKPVSGQGKPLEVEVVSLDWKWLFIYPDQGIASVNQLVAPTGAPIHLTLTSGSVMNAFFVPQLGSMIYTMNGMATQLYLRADRPGDYFGLSSMYSGDGFSDMRFETTAVTPAAFAAWTQAAKASGPVLDAAAYTALSRPGTAAPLTYRAVAPTLFGDIVSLKQPPGPGPANAPHAPAPSAPP